MGAYPPWVWPPISSVPPSLVAHAGPDSAVLLGRAKVLAGSATGGTPPYTYLWSVLSAPAGGVATFVDATNPTTSVTFTVATGVYRLLLKVTDAAGSHAFAVVTETVGLLLDSLIVQPLWAHCLGALLRVGQASIGTVQRADTAQRDLASFVVGSVVDTAALVAWGGVGDVELVDVANAVAASTHLSIIAPSPLQRAKVVVAGVAVLGSNGLLAALFDGVPGPGSGSDVYTRGDALGLAGDATITFVGDCNLANDAVLESYGGFAGIGEADNPAGNNAMSCALGYDAANDNRIYTETDFGGVTFASSYRAPRAVSSWWQNVHVSGDDIALATRSFGGLPATLAPFVGGAGSLNMTLPLGFWWGRFSPVFGAAIPGRASNLLCWNAALGATDQATVDAWELTAHA